MKYDQKYSNDLLYMMASSYIWHSVRYKYSSKETYCAGGQHNFFSEGIVSGNWSWKNNFVQFQVVIHVMRNGKLKSVCLESGHEAVIFLGNILPIFQL